MESNFTSIRLLNNSKKSINTTGRAQSTTQVKAVLSEKKCAKDIANYVGKKDSLPTVI